MGIEIPGSLVLFAPGHHCNERCCLFQGLCSDDGNAIADCNHGQHSPYGVRMDVSLGVDVFSAFNDDYRPFKTLFQALHLAKQPAVNDGVYKIRDLLVFDGAPA